MKNTIVVKLFRLGFYISLIIVGEAKYKPAADWWCDETECFYSDTIATEDTCVSNNSIPYRLNYTSGSCELNLKALLLSFRIISNRLGEIADEKNRRRNEEIFRGIIIAGKIFVGFATACVFIGCYYCCWVQYSDHRLGKSVKKAAKRVLARQQPNKYKQNIGEKCRTERMADEVQVSVV